MAPGRNLPQEVRNVQAQVEDQTDRHPKDPCTVCAGRHFHRHQRVDRVILVIYGGLVYRLVTFLMRWTCGDCAKTFRHYPREVLPYKRYIFVVVGSLCARYLREPYSSYRQVARFGGSTRSLPVFYAGPVAQADASEREKEREQAKALSHVTVWRWMAPLAKLVECCGQHLQRQLAQTDAVDFSPWSIAPWKYRSPQRQGILIRASQVLAALGFGKSPTDLGTMLAGP